MQEWLNKFNVDGQSLGIYTDVQKGQPLIIIFTKIVVAFNEPPQVVTGAIPCMSIPEMNDYFNAFNEDTARDWINKLKQSFSKPLIIK